jgi:hypothetical protein
MALNLVNLLNDYNGAVFLEPGSAEWSYVEPIWFLQLPYGHNIAANGAFALGTTAFGPNLSQTNFLKANYAALVDATALANADKALFGTLLRMHGATAGLIDSDLARRCVVEDEYVVRNPQNGNWDDAINAIPANARSREIAVYVKKYGDTFFQMMVYVFLARGHHWQDDYDPLYDRLLSACNVPRPTTWVLPTNREIFRQIMHCFGVHIPCRFALWCSAHNRMANPMRLRFNPHPPIAGAAQITTLAATLLEMHTEGWWGAFAIKFQPEIAAIDNEVAAIDHDPYRYHVASRVITGQAKIDLSPQSTAAFTSLAQYALGYIDYLGRKHSLAGQKVITQKAGGQKTLADTFSRACDRLGKPDINVADMATFINAL